MVIFDFPALRQTFNYDCGAIVLEAVLAYYGIEIREDHIIKQAKTSKNGTPIEGIVAVAKTCGLKCQSKKMKLTELKTYLKQKIPVILVLQAWTAKQKINWNKDWDDGHYVVAIGYDRSRIYFHDPSSFKYTYLTITELTQRWHDVAADGKKYFNHGIAVFGKKPVFSLKSVEHMG